MAGVLRAILPGLTVGACVAAAALPVRLATSEGFASMVLIVLAGVGGGAVGLALSSKARQVIRELVAKLRGG
jgi:hypothetical protein